MNCFLGLRMLWGWITLCPSLLGEKDIRSVDSWTCFFHKPDPLPISSSRTIFYLTPFQRQTVTSYHSSFSKPVCLSFSIHLIHSPSDYCWEISEMQAIVLIAMDRNKGMAKKCIEIRQFSTLRNLWSFLRVTSINYFSGYFSSHMRNWSSKSHLLSAISYSFPLSSTSLTNSYS